MLITGHNSRTELIKNLLITTICTLVLSQIPKSHGGDSV